MKKLNLAAATLALGFAAGAVQAQQADAWSGVYVGAQAGGAWTDQDSDRIAFDTNLDGGFGDTVRTSGGADAFSPGFCRGAARTATPAGGCDDDGDKGFEFGGRLGYDMQFGGFVVGVVGEVSRTDVEDAVSAFSTTPAFYTMERELDYLAAARVRAGYAFGRTLAYATGGYAHGSVERRFSTSNGVNTFTERDDDDLNGWQLGAGLEHQLDENVSVGVEYLHTSLKDEDYRVRASGPAPANNPFILVNPAGTDFSRSSDDFKVHSVRVTTSYRF